MKTLKTVVSQPKWICVASIGAVSIGALAGARARSAVSGLPAPPKLSQGSQLRPENRPPEDGDFQDGPLAPEGENGRPPGDEMGPPMDDEGMGPPPPPGGGEIGWPESGIGPGEESPERLGPGQPPREISDTADGAGRALNHAFHTAGQAAVFGRLPGTANEVFEQAHANYALALDAFNSKSYKKAATLADVSEHLAKATIALSGMGGPKVPEGWAAPPKLTANRTGPEADRVAMDLNRAYRELSKPTHQEGVAGAKLLTSARTLYKSASIAYAAKRWEQARSSALATNELIQAGHRLNDAQGA